MNASCVNLAEANAINKIWYGQTVDGTYPDPAVDNASDPTLASSNQLWWGLTRGAKIASLAGPMPFAIATDMVGVELQDSTSATPTVINAVSNGLNRWQQMTYADLASAYNQGIAMQSSFGNINTDNPDLTMARNNGAKIISFHGLADVLIAPQGSLNYFSRVSAGMGGDVETNKFNRLFLISGMGHCGGIGSVDGTAPPPLTPSKAPPPAATHVLYCLVASDY